MAYASYMPSLCEQSVMEICRLQSIAHKVENDVNNKNFNELHIKHDKKIGLFAVVALYDLSSQPALGGCRFVEYESENKAMEDAVLLAEAMHYKTAIAGVPFSGGKVVIRKPAGDFDRFNYFKSLGTFIQELNGKFITGCDSGVTQEDMRIAARYTDYITAVPALNESADYLIEITAEGVIKSIELAVKNKLHRSCLLGLRVTIQGVGKIGFYIAAKMKLLGCEVIVCDLDKTLAERAKNELGVRVVNPASIYQYPCDVFVPCGLGNTINDITIETLKTSIVCGGANNQLSSSEIGVKLWKKGVMYVPDFMANVGGTIFAAGAYHGVDHALIKEKALTHITNIVQHVIAVSEHEQRPHITIAKEWALQQRATTSNPDIVIS